MSLKVLVDGETVADIRAFFRNYECKVFAVEAGDAFEFFALTVEIRGCIPNPYITVSVLRDLRDFSRGYRFVRMKTENVDTMCIV